MKKESSNKIGIITKELLENKDYNGFYLNSIKKTDDPDCWKKQAKFFNIDEDFTCTIILTEERICPSWIVYPNHRTIANQEDNWYRKALVTISDNKKNKMSYKFISEHSFDNFIWPN
jgi:hypothetical protein